MIRFENVTKTFVMEGKRKTIMRDVSMTFPSGRSVGLLGRNGAGKSTLLQMIAGTMPPSSGRISSSGSISWPVGFAGSFHPELSGAQNCRFIGRIYGVDTDELIAFVEEFAGLGVHFHLPLKTYSSGMKSRLAFGASMGIAFDTYLVDEVTAVGDAAFRARSDALFKQRMRSAGSVVVSHAMGQIRQLCDAVVVLEDGHLTFYDDVEQGIRDHERNMQRGG
ncbi:ABC transporter ATP-binding protein [Alloyangia pacifica]|uniref:Capsular polysaccharide transport system ATP-binding protein n=1 Tax=Alloyangia pacifica TaxID=311180 RepID=A0A1I6RKN2_9RHOB|nr:ABC transporter ATP-binding protein [Alloyangia pacifica]SDI70025.1 capsular polysaccharide transport system ATP-binding protein [Alloyangia pacifica]SFS65242.1 capsular polysaccharide transport system ATP-binding protein [Alloyangia pacifica]